VRIAATPDEVSGWRFAGFITRPSPIAFPQGFDAFLKGGETLIHILEDSVVHGSNGCSHVTVGCFLLVVIGRHGGQL
jgi:hypothetical protein